MIKENENPISLAKEKGHWMVVEPKKEKDAPQNPFEYLGNDTILEIKEKEVEEAQKEEDVYIDDSE